MNKSNAGENDLRWQIPMKLHSGEQKVKTRARIEAILSKAGVLDQSFELTHDMGLLIGGTVDQSLHHDLGRQFVYWLPDPDSERLPTVGWEKNRIAYNDAMASKHAPSSVIIGVGRSDTIFLGVQKDRIERRIGDKCSIKNGRAGEVFTIVRENEHLVVLEVKTGCQFTGDFPHAGVRNVLPGTAEDKLMIDLNQKIGKVLKTAAQNMTHEEVIHAMSEIFCNFKGLDRLCRFHCSTELIETKMVIPRNTVGFTDCYDNRPDGSGGVSNRSPRQQEN
jgi:hypothetical protein